jgi:hypothetical protein
MAHATLSLHENPQSTLRIRLADASFAGGVHNMEPRTRAQFLGAMSALNKFVRVLQIEDLVQAALVGESLPGKALTG